MDSERILDKFMDIEFEGAAMAGVLNPEKVREGLASDIDVLLILDDEIGGLSSRGALLTRTLDRIRESLEAELYAFSTFKHQMFYVDEMRRLGVEKKPIHLLPYPNPLYMSIWEPRSRVESMLYAADFWTRTGGIGGFEWGFETADYHPAPFLQLLYEAQVLDDLSDLESRAVRWDVSKKVEFALKNLLLESGYASGLADPGLKGGWDDVIDLVSLYERRGLDMGLLREVRTLRREGSCLVGGVSSLFQRSHSLYDTMVEEVFGSDWVSIDDG